mmetsp:Transcript_38967/g.125961  ORF Transcript_38967/g.125961 Transcript_38967/m.125961 type:complete len:281 (-) Transcript_38967:841-1683(-)
MGVSQTKERAGGRVGSGDGRRDVAGGTEQTTQKGGGVGWGSRQAGPVFSAAAAARSRLISSRSSFVKAAPPLRRPAGCASVALTLERGAGAAGWAGCCGLSSSEDRPAEDRLIFWSSSRVSRSPFARPAAALRQSRSEASSSTWLRICLKNWVVSEAPRRRPLPVAVAGSVSCVADALICAAVPIAHRASSTAEAVGRAFASTESIACTSCSASAPRSGGTGEVGFPSWIRRTRACTSPASKGRAEARSAYRMTPHDQMSVFVASYPSRAAPSVMSSGAA